MGLIKDKTLAKLTITAYRDRELRRRVGRLAAHYNPETLNLNYQADYRPDDFVNSDTQRQSFKAVRPGDLALNLLFDTTLPGAKLSIDEDIGELRKLCITPDPVSQEPHFLKIEWGRMNWAGSSYFAGRARSLSISYLLFKRSGAPTRATAALVLAADERAMRKDDGVTSSTSSGISGLSGTTLSGHVLDGSYLELARGLRADTLGQLDEPRFPASWSGGDR